MFDTLLIANRGEIACRIARTARRLGLRSVAVYSAADRESPHVALCDAAVAIGPAEAARSYLDADAIIAAARASGAQAIHPGYGFLSESLTLIDACAAAGIAFVGPSREAIRRMGSKIESKRIAVAAGVPVVPGYHGDAQDDASLLAAANAVGYPLLIKASAGGGGKGMRVVTAAAEFVAALHIVRREAKAAFGDDQVLLERYLAQPRHLEVQLLGDRHGHLLHLFERECSIQRHHQKVIEEAPAPHLDETVREALYCHALALGQAIGYDNAGTVEFIHDDASGETFFLEMNTRLQVEHPVTELTCGIDLVEWQLRIAAGQPLDFTQQDIRRHGWAIEARVCAENPAAGFAADSGKILACREPRGEGVRVDSGIAAGVTITPYYDSLLAKVIAHGDDRASAARRLTMALDDFVLLGVRNNLGFLADLLRQPDFAQPLSTHYIARAFPDGWQARGTDAALCAAALYCVLSARNATSATSAMSASPWQTLGPWRNVGAGETAVLLADAAQEVHEIGIRRVGDQWQVRCGDETHTVTAKLSGGQLQIDGLDAAGDTLRYELAAEPPQTDGQHLWLSGLSGLSGPGGTHTWLWLDRWQRALRGQAASEGAQGNRLCAPMPGMITAVNTTVDALVEAGAPLLAMEAMKMVHTLTAPVAGRIAELRCRPGDAARGGDVLLVIEAVE